MRRFTFTELLDRARQAALSRVESLPYLQNWVLPDKEDCFKGDAGQSAGFARLSELLPLGPTASVSARGHDPDPRQWDLLRQSADDVLEGYFNLLGMERLAFGCPVDWHFEPTSGKKIPLMPWKRLDSLDASVTGDKKVIWELNRHQHLVMLGRAYLHDGEERYAEAIVDHIVSWIKANPAARGINWVSSVDVAFRCISWLWAIALLRNWRKWPSLPVNEIVQSLCLHGHHIETYLSTYFSPNTHLTGEALGLYYLGTCLPDLKHGRRWRDLGRSILLEQLEIQVRPDGVYFEQSTWYQRYTADFYMHFILLARRAGDPIPPRVSERLSALVDYLMWVTRPDGTSPYVGDDDGGKLLDLEARPPNDWRAVLSNAAVMYGRGDYKYVADDYAGETHWLLGEESKEKFDRIAAIPPQANSRAFLDGGFYVMRSGWNADSNYLLIDCGPHGVMNAGHAHSDALSFELAARGATILVDPGTYSYAGDSAFRNLFRSTPMHNTLVLDDMSSSVPAGPFQWKHIAACTTHCWHDHPTFSYFDGSHDGYMRFPQPATHARSLFFASREYWVMVDSVEGEGSHECALHFHMAPGVRATLNQEAGRLEANAGAAMLDIIFGEGQGTWTIVDGLVSPCYGAKEAAPHGIFSVRTSGPASLLSVLYPRTSDEPAPGIQRLDVGQGSGMVLTSPRFRDLLLRSARPVPTEGIHGANFEWIWLRRSSREGRIEQATLLHGCEFLSEEVEVRTEGNVEFVALKLNDRVLSVDVSPPARIRISQRIDCDRIVVNGRAHPTDNGELLDILRQDMPALALACDQADRCRHVRN